MKIKYLHKHTHSLFEMRYNVSISESILHKHRYILIHIHYYTNIRKLRRYNNMFYFIRFAILNEVFSIFDVLLWVDIK